jgi:MoaA/NifB/PqqE/SkfB family radical SAM enzyme
MHKDIIKILNKTSDLSIDLSIITNGQNLNKGRAEALIYAKWVRISMDYLDGIQLKKFRNVSEKSFDSILNNINYFAKLKHNDCNLSVNYIIHKDNYKGLYQFTKKLKDYGVENVRFSPMYVDNFFDYHSSIQNKVSDELNLISNLIDQNFSVNTTYNINASTSHSAIRNYKKCYIMETVPVIGADLGVYTCHNKAYDKKGLIGSLRNNSFKDLWYSAETVEFMNSFNAKLNCLHECSNDRKNILINNLIDSSTDNFI